MAHQDLPPKQYKALTLTQLAGYDDLITDALVDRAFFWTTIRKNRARYSACRGITEEQITDILRNNVIVDPDPRLAFDKLSALPGIRRYVERLSTDTERNHFNTHLRKYINMYLPDAPFEISTTNRYKIDDEEAAVFARRDIRKGEPIRHLTGIQVPITPEEESNLDLTRRDFSIVISSRKRMSSLFLGPARFANHDCDANAKLQTKGPNGMTVQAVKNIRFGDEITVSYGENYFGIDNCECLCGTCESKARNGWATPEEDEEEEEDVEMADDDESHLDSDHSSRLTRTSASRGRSGDYSRTREDQTPETSGSRNNKKRKMLEVEEFERTGRSPKRPELSRLQASAPSQRPHSTPLTPPYIPQDQFSRPMSPERSAGSSTGESSKSRTLEDSGYESVAGSVEGHDAHKPLEERSSGFGTTNAPPTRFGVMDRYGGTASIDKVRDTMSITNILNDQRSSSFQQASLPPGSCGGVTPTQEHYAESVTPSVPKSLYSAEGTPASSRSRSVLEEPPAVSKRKTAHRRPGDYTLTPALLSEPYSRWVECQVCDDDFVQQNAYQTRFSCPRCERHSKLYGYRWPKTMKLNGNDEERIMDPREINRFVDPSEEKAISKGKTKALRKLLSERETGDVRSESIPEPTERTKNGRTFRASLGMRKIDEPNWDEFDHVPKKKVKAKKPDPPKEAPKEPGKVLGKRGRKPKDANQMGNKRLKVVKPGTKQDHASKEPRGSETPKRKYIRSGLFSKNPAVRDAAVSKLQTTSAKADAKVKAREQEKRKKEQQLLAATKKAKQKPQLPPSLKPSKWKGYALEIIPVDQEIRNMRKLYTTESKHWEPDSDRSEESTPRSSKRPIRPTPKSESYVRTSLVRDRDRRSLNTNDRRRGRDDSTSPPARIRAWKSLKKVKVEDTSSEEEDGASDSDSSEEEIRDSDPEFDSSEIELPPGLQMSHSSRATKPPRSSTQSNRRTGGHRRLPTLSVTPMSLRTGNRRSSTATSRADSFGRSSAVPARKPKKVPGLPKGWAWPETDDLLKLQQLEREKQEREQAVAQKRRIRRTM